jgi:hypothetical protein
MQAYVYPLTETASGSADPPILHTQVLAAYEAGEPLEGAPGFLGVGYNVPAINWLEMCFDAELDSAQQSAVTDIVQAHNGVFPVLPF